MADAPDTSGAATVTDRRPVPRGVLPRGMQTWLMAGIAAVMVAIMFLAGRPQPVARSVAVIATPAPAPSPDRMREYQDRLRLMEARAAQEAQASTPAAPAPPPTYTQQGASSPTNQDPIVAERKRKEYESLFASNVVLSRRP